MFRRIGTDDGLSVDDRKRTLVRSLKPGECIVKWHIKKPEDYVEATIFDGVPEEEWDIQR